MKFNFMDPFNNKNNVGGKYIKTRDMQNMFRSLYYFMSQPAVTPYLPQLFQLNLLLWRKLTCFDTTDFFYIE